MKVAKVSAFKESCPDIARHIFSAIDACTLQLERTLTSTSAPIADIHNVFNANHACLKALGVSHQTIDEIKTYIDTVFPCGLKITGAGGG
jgi:mevalonate kinase